MLFSTGFGLHDLHDLTPYMTDSYMQSVLNIYKKKLLGNYDNPTFLHAQP